MKLLTFYCPTTRFPVIDAHLTGMNYTKLEADGFWQGEHEDTELLLIADNDGDYLELKASVMAQALLRAGEEAVLYYIQTVEGRLVTR